MQPLQTVPLKFKGITKWKKKLAGIKISSPTGVFSPYDSTNNALEDCKNRSLLRRALQMRYTNRLHNIIYFLPARGHETLSKAVLERRALDISPAEDE